MEKMEGHLLQHRSYSVVILSIVESSRHCSASRPPKRAEQTACLAAETIQHRKRSLSLHCLAVLVKCCQENGEENHMGSYAESTWAADCGQSQQRYERKQSSALVSNVAAS